MDAQQVAALLRRVADADASRDRARAEAASWLKQLQAEQAAHAATKAAAAAAAASAASAAAAAVAATEADFRAKLHASHMRELDADIARDVTLVELRRGHVAEVAAARTSERKRLQAAVGPGLLLLEETGRGLRRRLATVEEVASEERMMVWDRLAAMPAGSSDIFFQQ
jgi:hypothetical protein